MQFSRRRLSAALTPVAFSAAAIVVIGLLGGGPSSAATSSRLDAASHTAASRSAASRSAASHTAASHSAAGHSAAGHPAATPPVIIDCLSHGQVRPGSFIFTCADANSGVTRTHWATWGSSAYGTGAYFQNDCVPSCAQGTMFYFPTLVVLWHPQPLPHHPATRYFTRMTRILTGRHCLPEPGGNRQCLPVTSTVQLSSSGGIS